MRIDKLPVSLKIVITILAVGLSAIPAVCLFRYGIHYFDEPYQLLLGMFPQAAPYTPGSSFLTSIIGTAVEWKDVYFRAIAVAVNILSILMASLYFYARTRRFAFFLLITVVGILLCSSVQSAWNIYGWDTWTRLLITASLISILETVRRPSFMKVQLCTVITAAATLVRVPNVGILAVTMACIGWLWYKKRISSSACITYLISYIIVSLGFIYLSLVSLYGSISEYIQTYAGVTMGVHSVSEIITSFIYGSSLVFFCVMYLCSNYNLLVFTASHRLRYFTLLFYFVTFIVVVFVVNATLSVWHANIMYAIISIVFLSTGSLFFIHYKELDSEILFRISVALFVCLIPILGSNTGITKFLAWVFFIVFLIDFCKYIKTPQIKFFVVVCIAIFTATIWIDSRLSFEDDGWRFAPHEQTEGRLAYLYTGDVRNEEINSTLSMVQPYIDEGYEVMVQRLGPEYIWEFLFGSYNAYLNSQFDFEEYHFNDDYVNWAEQQILEAEKPLVILYQKHDNFEETDIPDLPMLQMIERYLQRVDENKRFILYASPRQVAKENS